MQRSRSDSVRYRHENFGIQSLPLKTGGFFEERDWKQTYWKYVAELTRSWGDVQQGSGSQSSVEINPKHVV